MPGKVTVNDILVLPFLINLNMIDENDYDFKLQIGILGDAKVGKSTLFYQYMVHLM